MMPSRFWLSTKGSIMPFSCAMRRIQRSESMAILVVSERGAWAFRRAGPLAQSGAQSLAVGFLVCSLARDCALRRLRFSRNAAARRSARGSPAGAGFGGLAGASMGERIHHLTVALIQ